PHKYGKRYFQLRNSGLQNQDALYVSEDIADEPRLLVDPNALASDGTVALGNWVASHDGKYLAYATSASGSDWLTWRVLDVDSGKALPDIIEWSKFTTAAWMRDNSGFFYSRYEPPAEMTATYLSANYSQKLYFHALGTQQGDDELIYARPDQKEWGFQPTVSDDARYLLLNVWQGSDERNRFFYQDLQKGGAIVELVSELIAAFDIVGNDGPVFYFRTDLEAPRGRLIAIDTENPARENWHTVIPESTDTLEQVVMVHDEFIALYLHDATHRIRRYSRVGELVAEIELPTLGSIGVNNASSLHGHREDDEFFYVFHSFVHPPTVYRYDMVRGTNQAIWSPSVDFDFAPYVTRQVFATSKDGTRVPMFLTHRRDLKLDGSHPTLLWGYGGFNVAVTPTFMASRLWWLEAGGVLAIANLRGGAEYGEGWHRAGTLHNKQNVFDDFIACAEYLIREKITTTSRLAIEGRSNGGLLVGACLTQRPDLYGACLAHVGVMDMLRFHRFTIGWGWVSDYGSSDDPDLFKTLIAYSPLHNIRPGVEYPATLVTTGDHDDRVVPGHSFKFAAALQAAQSGRAPILIRIQKQAGHGMGKPTAMLIEEQADIFAFLVKTLNL
ncbi:MAG TPA: prolyl oligopeptidase family serine peptidase, partial [Anaerolineae bacterium]